jgi:hypothetical protein
MKLAVRQSQRLELALSDEGPLPGLLGMGHQLLILSFRKDRVRVLAGHNPEGQQCRAQAPAPVTDPLRLELLTGSGEAPGWGRPVSLEAVVEACPDPVLAVQRASRWASYAARVAVVPQERLDDRALLEAQLRGVWVVTAAPAGRFEVAVAGERAAAAGSVRGLAHRLLDELAWEALRRRDSAAAGEVRPVATRRAT